MLQNSVLLGLRSRIAAVQSDCMVSAAWPAFRTVNSAKNPHIQEFGI